MKHLLGATLMVFSIGMTVLGIFSMMGYFTQQATLYFVLAILSYIQGRDALVGEEK